MLAMLSSEALLEVSIVRYHEFDAPIERQIPGEPLGVDVRPSLLGGLDVRQPAEAQRLLW